MIAQKLQEVFDEASEKVSGVTACLGDYWTLESKEEVGDFISTYESLTDLEQVLPIFKETYEKCEDILKDVPHKTTINVEPECDGGMVVFSFIIAFTEDGELKQEAFSFETDF